MAASFMERKQAELLARGIEPERLPPGQYATDRFPILHLGPVPEYPTLDEWSLVVDGDGVAAPRRLTWEEFRQLPTADVTTDIHCVTKWSKFDVRWRGVRLADVLAPSAPTDDATTLIAIGEHDFSASMSYREVTARECLLAFEVDGAQLAPEHGYPLRLVVPHLYFWKSVKWLRGLRLLSDTGATGFWERNGYHDHGDPFREQRYWGDDA